jgi:hypothetical protein
MYSGRLAQPKEPGNKEHDDDDADDVKNIHGTPIEACTASNEGAAALRGYALEGIKFRFADLLEMRTLETGQSQIVARCYGCTTC